MTMRPAKSYQAEATRAFTPRKLSERWECSERHVRNVIKQGRLRYFRLGEKLIRIPLEAVEEYEQCQNSGLSPTEASSRSSGGTIRASDIEDHSEHPFVVKWMPGCDNLGGNTTKPHGRSK